MKEEVRITTPHSTTLQSAVNVHKRMREEEIGFRRNLRIESLKKEHISMSRIGWSGNQYEEILGRDFVQK